MYCSPLSYFIINNCTIPLIVKNWGKGKETEGREKEHFLFTLRSLVLFFNEFLHFCSWTQENAGMLLPKTNTVWYVKGTSANAAVNLKGKSQVRGMRDEEWREGETRLAEWKKHRLLKRNGDDGFLYEKSVALLHRRFLLWLCRILVQELLVFSHLEPCILLPWRISSSSVLQPVQLKSCWMVLFIFVSATIISRKSQE